MKRRCMVSMVALLAAACGSPAPRGPEPAANGGGSHAGRVSSAEREAQGKQMDAAQGASRRDNLKRYVDSYLNESRRSTKDVQEKLLTGARVALGEEKARGARDSSSVGVTIGKLKAVGIHPKLTANPEFQQGFLLPDGKAYAAELAKVPRDKDKETRQVWSDFASQTTTITWASYLASQQQIGLHLQAVAIAGAVVANRKKYSLEPSADEVAIVKKALDEARRGDELAAAGAGLSAAMVAVTSGGKPAKALEDMARAVKQSVPSTATATDEEAKAYLDGFEGGLGDARERYESMLQKSYGAAWERSSMKGMLTAAFKVAGDATTQKSQADRRAERDKRAAAHAPMTTKEPANAGANVTPPPGGAGVVGTVKSLLPSDGPIGGAITVVDALKNGDAKGALKGALGFVPPGPIKLALNVMSSFF